MANPVDILNAGTEVPLGATSVPQNTIATVDLDDPDVLEDVVRYVDQLLGVAGAGGAGDAVLAANQTFTGDNTFDGLVIIGDGAGGVQTAVSSAGQILWRSKVLGDSAQRFQIATDGKLTWGDGTGVNDISIERTGGGVFTIDAPILFPSDEYIEATDGNSPTDVLIRGAVNSDTNVRFALYRSGTMEWGTGSGGSAMSLALTAVDMLTTTGTLQANLPSNIPGFATKRSTDANNKWEVDRDGAIRWLDGTGTLKTILSRSGDDMFLIPAGAGGGKFTVGDEFEVGTNIAVLGNSQLGDSPADTVAFHGVAGVAQQATPVTLGDVITVLQNLGLVA